MVEAFINCKNASHCLMQGFGASIAAHHGIDFDPPYQQSEA